MRTDDPDPSAKPSPPAAKVITVLGTSDIITFIFREEADATKMRPSDAVARAVG